MKQQIANTYQNLIELLSNLEKARIVLQRQDFYQANNILKREMLRLQEILMIVLEEQGYFLHAATDISQENILFLLNSLLSTLEGKEYVFLADLLSQSVLPFLYALQEHIVMEELAEPIRFSASGRDYQIEYTSCGLPTVKVFQGEMEFYLHSNRNARQEAEEIAAGWKAEGKTEYIIFGMGLGYAVTALLEGNEYISAQVFESDAALVDLSRQYGDYGRLMATGRVKIQVDKTGAVFAKEAARNPEAEPVFFYPSLRLISDKKAAEQMEDLFISQISQKTQYPAMRANFQRNILCYDAPVDALKTSFMKKRVYLVAGGPSLDKNCDLLKQIGTSGIIVAVGTVLKKLLKKGIRPDYVVVSDAKANTFRQVDGICEEGIPIWGLSTAYYRFFTDYHAKHYLVCQQGFEPAEKFAAQNGYFLIDTCGSVIEVALDTVLKLGAAEVVFIGLDLAFTGGRHHAEDTDHTVNQVHGEQRMVVGIDGSLVPTGRNLDIYRKFIEKKIAETRKVRFIDATEGGARIVGAEILPLGRVIKKDSV